MLQERFLISGSSTSTKKQIYWIPITYTTEEKHDFNNTTPRLWLSEESKSIPFNSSSWFVLNIQEIGVYRVNYDHATWQQLINLLNSDNFTQIDEVNRAQIVDDSLNLARAGYIDYQIPLGISKYLVKETSHLPYKAYFNAASYLAQRIQGNPHISKLYARHVQTLIDEICGKLGTKENMRQDTHLDQLNRELVWTHACQYGHPDCLGESKNYFVHINETR